MSFVLVSAEDIHYGPTSISTEDSALPNQISILTISTKTAKSGGSPQAKTDKIDRIKAKFESKVKELKDKSPEKMKKLEQKMEQLIQREKERVGVMEGKKVKFDPNAKSIVIKVEDAPVRVLNTLAQIGYQITPSSSGSSARGGQVWTLFRAGYYPTIYPELNNLNIKEFN